MIYQLEDCIDVLFVVNGTLFDYLFLFDHSCGHDRMRPDALNINSMNVGYGGKGTKMHCSVIKSHAGYLGTYHYPDHDVKQLSVGDTASMVFTEQDVGPFHLTKEERERTKHDVIIGLKSRNKSRAELIEELKSTHHIENVRGTKADILKIAQEKNIEVKVTENKIKEGWVGKPKGMKQIAFERRFINLDELSLYTKDGHKDENGNVTDDTHSIKCIIGECIDFIEEKTLLQTMGEEIGHARGLTIIVDRSAKCHPETAGEGIEYTWAHSKIYQRNKPFTERRSISQFKDNLRLSLSTDAGANLNRSRIRRFAARARDYIAAYYLLDNKNDDVSTRLSKKDIDKMCKVYRCHRNIQDIEVANVQAEAALT